MRIRGIYQHFFAQIVNSFYPSEIQVLNPLFLKFLNEKLEHFLPFYVMVNMKQFFQALLLTFIVTNVISAQDLSGTWQGVVIRAGQKMEQGTVLYADFQIVDGVLSGLMREETYNTDYFGLKQIKGSFTEEMLKFEQFVVVNNETAFRSKWCLLKGSLVYDSNTGYLKGQFTSTDCRNVLGEIILYQADFELSQEKQSHATHLWFNSFVKDYNDGLSAPKIRAIERENFVFEPIYFDFDKAEIREEHKEFLDRMIKIVKGHSDLRVLVTGHTDSDGSNSYNDSLSKRRAQAIINYFVAHGLSEDHLKFDFKGETDPAATNNTPEGRQRNRRVDFKFINEE